MLWADHNRRMRRFLRDPDRNIWTDALLTRLFNDAQNDLAKRVPILENAAPVYVPPRYDCAYMHDWEYEFAKRAFGPNVYQCWHYHQQSGMVASHRWMLETIGLGDGQSTDAGDAFTNPWEAWHAPGGAGRHVPVPLPADFRAASLIAWDEEPLEPVNLKDIQMETSNWIQESGDPRYYWRDPAANEIQLFPMPDAPDWADEIGSGMVVLDSDETASSDTGIVAAADGAMLSQNMGAAFSSIGTTDTLFTIYQVEPIKLSGDGAEESSWPSWAAKYVESGAISEAFLANTDGQIDSLHQYWAYRKKLGIEALNRLRLRMLSDIDFRLSTQGGGSARRQRGPHLPDNYPAGT